MISIEPSENAPLIINNTVTSPIVYLDYCVICDFAKNPKLGDEFRDVLLNKNGTLCLSAAHMIELFGLGAGLTYMRVRGFLKSLKRNWAIMEFNAKKVIEREDEVLKAGQNPAIDIELLKEMILKWDGLSDLSLDLAFDELEKNPSEVERSKTRHKNFKFNLQNSFQKVRHAYRENKEIRQRIDKNSFTYLPGKPPTKYIYDSLMRECIITNEEFNSSDGLDFYHSVVSTAYTDFVVLDKKWARRLRKLDLPKGSATIFSTIEYPDFLSHLKNWQQVH